MPEHKPAAFLSYVHSDDKYGHVTAFRERLSDEVQMQVGIEFPIFQDRKDIQWGDNWRERIEGSLDAVTFLIPVVTPSFFNSEHCRAELRRFLKRQQELGRGDLILPVYFIDTPLLNEDELRDADALARAVAACQYADWRELRLEPLTSPTVLKTLAQLARQIRDALRRTGALGQGRTSKPADKPTQRPAAVLPPALPTVGDIGAQAHPGPSSKNEPPTHIVDAWHRGDYATVSEAIAQSAPGDRIVVRPGVYDESLVIDKPLEIIGDGDASDIVIQGQGATIILFKTTMGRVSNLTLRATRERPSVVLEIAQGHLELEGCTITSGGGYTGILIWAGADPRLRRNRIHDCMIGVSVYEGGLGTLEDNEIFGNTVFGVQVMEGGKPTFRRNRIYKNGIAAILCLPGADGVFEDNDLRDNPKESAEPGLNFGNELNLKA
ncbi:MAG TPA: right-handed parallel beta-helix repeat-containing protein [Pyrinomonadaceae bacterium]|nr:right-handed parallel beta-helix repeat-containing protein [Pyrinomonadaceae bacterium]